MPIHDRHPLEYLLVMALGITVVVDTVCGVALVVALEPMLALAGLPDGPVARHIMPALGVTLVGVAAFAGCALWWSWRRQEQGYVLAMVLGAMLIGVGVMQWRAGAPTGLWLDATRGVATLGLAWWLRNR